MGKFGLRREAQRHAAFARTGRVQFPIGIVRPKAPSPLRSAGALQDVAVAAGILPAVEPGLPARRKEPSPARSVLKL
jgi:hypothetical protein